MKKETKDKLNKNREFDLRHIAEEKLKHAASETSEPDKKSTGEIIHELQVHQIELEMQNEELKRTQLALEESRNKYLDLYDFAPVGYFSFTNVGRIVETNLTGAALLGVDRQKIINRGFGSFVSPEDLDLWERHLAKSQQPNDSPKCDRNTCKCALKLKREDGIVFHAQLESVPFEQPSNTPLVLEDDIGTSCAYKSSHSSGIPVMRTALIDVTARKRAEEERDRAETQLRQAQKMEAYGQLAGGIAHDFNNLLGIILGSCDMARLSIPNDHPVFNHLEVISKVVERATSVTGQLLAFSRKQLFQPRKIDLNIVIDELKTTLRRTVGEHIQFITKLDSKLNMVMADPAQMGQMLINMVVNAKDAMPTGGTLTIETRNHKLNKSFVDAYREIAPGKYVKITVSDTGIGMSEEIKKHLFEPFFTTKETGKGTGLGLSTVFGIVKQSGGVILADSKPGNGTTFTIYLPSFSTDTEAEAILVGKPEKLVGGGETVLVVEDTVDLLKLFCKCLGEQGYQILAAGDAEEAISLSDAHQDRIHLMLTDVLMPGMNGSKLFTRICERRPEIKVIFMSGFSNGELTETGILPPNFPYLGKPFSIAKLISKVRETLDAPLALNLKNKP